MDRMIWWALGGAVLVYGLRWTRARFVLSRAKHPSIHGHARWAKRLARVVPFYEYDDTQFFSSDHAPADVARRRREAFERFAGSFASRSPLTVAETDQTEAGLSDLQFTRRYRVPFQYSRRVARDLSTGSFARSTSGVRVTDLDGHEAFDLTGSYG